jgi:tRNA G10  N-methylase Trm11
MAVPVLAAQPWRTNAELIADVASLGYLKKDDLTLDPTWGRGIWWNVWQPTTLVKHDLYKLDGVDFRDLPEEDDTFDAIAFDPPYVSAGGRSTTTIPEFHDRFGMTKAPSSPAGLQDMINDGIAELQRVLKPKKVLLVKSKNYVSSNKLWLGTIKTLNYAQSLGFECLDMLQHLSGTMPQPPGRRQVHARQNYSTLLVLKNKAK